LLLRAEIAGFGRSAQAKVNDLLVGHGEPPRHARAITDIDTPPARRPLARIPERVKAWLASDHGKAQRLPAPRS
jgi:hypothetical protein